MGTIYVNIAKNMIVSKITFKSVSIVIHTALYRTSEANGNIKIVLLTLSYILYVYTAANKTAIHRAAIRNSFSEK